MKDAITEKLYGFILEGEDDMAREAAADALKEGVTPTRILEIVANGGDVLGKKFEKGEIFLPSLFIGAEAMGAALEEVLPIFESSQGEYKGKVVMGTVEGDVHDLGKRVVIAMLTGGGFKVYDLGTDVTAHEFVEKALEVEANIIGASSILATTARRLPDIGEVLEARGLRSKIKYMIGGAAVTRDMVGWAGADEYGETAFQAVAIARQLMDGLRSEN